MSFFSKVGDNSMLNYASYGSSLECWRWLSLAIFERLRVRLLERGEEDSLEPHF